MMECTSILHPHNLNFKVLYLVCTTLLHLLPNSIPTTQLSLKSIALPCSDIHIYTSGQARTTYGSQATHRLMGLNVWPLTTDGSNTDFLWVQTRPKLLDFSGEKILSMSSFGGKVEPLVPCRSFAACKKSLQCSRKS
jgi:hypothetical protein